MKFLQIAGKFTLKYLFICLGVCPYMIGCGENIHSRPSLPSAIIGASDLQKVQGSQEKFIQAVGRMTIGCTVTHIGDGVVITAGHCFEESIITPENPCGKETDVQWGVTEENPNGYLTSKCVAILERQFDMAMDYAILKYSPAPKAAFEVSIDEPAIGTQIAIYSHPQGRTLEWSGWCDVTEIDLISPNRFHYECDTEPGSSGASVISSADKVIGIHNGAGGMMSYNLGTSTSSIEYFKKAK